MPPVATPTMLGSLHHGGLSNRGTGVGFPPDQWPELTCCMVVHDQSNVTNQHLLTLACVEHRTSVVCYRDTAPVAPTARATAGPW